MIIIIIHELGHILTSLYFNWNIEIIKILPFGGITIFNEDINRPLKEELVILISGPLSQLLICTIIGFYINNYYFLIYNYSILVFNILPIIPLDGSKFINICSNYFFSYLNSYRITNIVSLLTIILIIIRMPFNLIMYAVIFFLLIENIRSISNEYFIFNRFLLERYNKDYYFIKHHKIIGPKLKKMKRDRTHLFYISNKWYTEKDIIKKRFDL